MVNNSEFFGSFDPEADLGAPLTFLGHRISKAIREGEEGAVEFEKAVAKVCGALPAVCLFNAPVCNPRLDSVDNRVRIARELLRSAVYNDYRIVTVKCTLPLRETHAKEMLEFLTKWLLSSRLDDYRYKQKT